MTSRLRKVPVICAALAFVLGVFYITQPTYAEEQPSEVRSQSTTQMNSAPENVNVNIINDSTTRMQNFNSNWKFKFGDVSGAENATYDDSSWESVNLPHDYSIDQPYSQSGEAESAYKPGGEGWYRKTFEVSSDLQGKRFRLDFDGVYMDSTVWVNGHMLGTHPYGYTPFAFDITPYIKPGEQNVITVRVNAQTPSSRWYSGAGIGRDVDLVVTNPVYVAKDGVKATAPNLASEIGGSVTTQLTTSVTNSSDSPVNVQVVQTIFARGTSPQQAIASVTTERSITANMTDTFNASAITASSPALWDIDNPNLYTVRTEVKVDGNVVDTYDTTFGYRYFSFDAEKGFLLNGRPVKIKGVCMHHDQGALGSVSTADAVKRQVQILKNMGVNAIRTSHNTPSRELIEACNEQGVLLDYEFFDGWTAAKNGNNKDYARFFSTVMGESEFIGGDANKTWAQFDLEASVARDYNAPSIVMWSLGNEMTEGTYGIYGLAQVQNSLISWTQAVDPTRPVTTGDNQLKRGSNELNPQGIADAGGIVGMNYAGGSTYDSIHSQHPDWKLIGSETASSINSRGIYSTHSRDNSSQQLTAYDYSRVNWGHYASQAWYDVLTRDFVAGEFVWTGFDYLGEPTPWNGVDSGAKGRWPSPKNSYFGIIDTAGLPKDSYYFYQSQWNDAVHTLHLLPAWNGDAVKKNRDGTVDVSVYTDAHAVRLYFTPAGSKEKQDLGLKTFTTKTTPTNGFTYQIYEGADKSTDEFRNLYLTWQVPYADGTITAEAYDEAGNVIDTSSWDGRQSLTTAGQPKKLSVSVNRSSMSANGTDLAYLTVDVVDENGNRVPDANNKVTFDVSGSGKLAGIDNGSAPDHQSYRDANRDAFSGQVVGIVQAGTKAGEVTVRVSADGLEPTEVTIPVTPANTSDDTPQKTVGSLFYSRYYYVKTGSSLTLPQTIQARYTDGTASDEPVVWDSYDAEKLNSAGTFTVSGTVAGVRATVTVTVLDNIAALMNYSTTTPVGQNPILPDARPAVQADGTVLRANFPVTWNAVPEGSYNQEGTVTVTGTANVFGRDMSVTATVRVQRETVTLGENVASVASVSQDIPEDKQSDTLSAITDGSTSVADNQGGGANPTCWTTYKNAQAGNQTASITFRYATQQRIGQARVHFFVDSYSARLPKPGSTIIEVSENGEDWTRVDAQETVGQAQGRVTPYTYNFAPVTATYVRLTITNSDEVLAGRKPCTGITEVELFSAVGSFTTNNTASFDSLSVNGKQVSEDALAAGEYNTPALLANVEAQTKDNAALTILPPYQNKVRMLLESEDHTARSTFTVNLGVDQPITDDSDAQDYPVDQMLVSAGSEVEDRYVSPNEGKALLAFDGNPSTYWHSTWAPSSTDDHWVQMELDEPTSIEALRYLPRPNSPANGTVTEVLVEYSDDGVTWHEAGRATWTSPTSPNYTPDWKIVKFNQPVTAKYFRLTGVHTYADGGRNDKFMSAAEIRLRTTKATTDISYARIEVPSNLTVDSVSESNPAMFNPSDVHVYVPSTKSDESRRTRRSVTDETELRYGIDYVLEYENNTSEGTATVRARGIDSYTGTTAPTSFTVALTQVVVDSVSVASTPTKTAYTVGEKLDPSGIKLTLAMSNGTSQEITYSEDNKDDFTFDPSVEVAFDTAGTHEITVIYQGKSATFEVTVTQAANPDNPANPANPTNPSDPSNPANPADPSNSNGNQNADNGANNANSNTDQGAPSKKKRTSALPGMSDSTMLVAACGLFAIGITCAGGGYWVRKRRH